MSQSQTVEWLFKNFGEGSRVCDQIARTTECGITTMRFVKKQYRKKSFRPVKTILPLLRLPRLKNHGKGRHFRTLENIQIALTDQLESIPVSEIGSTALSDVWLSQHFF